MAPVVLLPICHAHHDACRGVWLGGHQKLVCLNAPQQVSRGRCHIGGSFVWQRGRNCGGHVDAIFERRMHPRLPFSPIGRTAAQMSDDGFGSRTARETGTNETAQRFATTGQPSQAFHAGASDVAGRSDGARRPGGAVRVAEIADATRAKRWVVAATVMIPFRHAATQGGRTQC